MTTAYLLVVLLARGTGASDWPTISLELRAPAPRARPTPGSRAALDDLMSSAAQSSPPEIEMSLTVRASRAGDVRFNRRAFALEVQAPAGNVALPPPKHGDPLDPPEPDYVVLGAGQTMRLTLSIRDRCRAGARGETYTVVGVFTGDENNFPFRLRPRDGATLVTRRVESNPIVIHCSSAARR